ncbi:LCCL domain protein [Apiospora phragmitis]|uniref:LCCL domain protein n=1 Tax=Apiospora phragmitis TaxID=2905665 RepID=A0ABR1VEC3_9PEZI
MSSSTRCRPRADLQSESSQQASKGPRKLSNGWAPKPAAATSQQLPPARWFRQKLPCTGQRMTLYLVVSLLSALAVLMLSSTGSGVPPMEVKDGVYQPVEQLSCTDSFWLPDNGCGVEGKKCQPFSENVLAFRCPSGCVAAAKKRTGSVASSSKERPHYVGPEAITDGRPLVVGAGPYFRADSHICAAAVYSEILDDAKGGCGIATTSGMTSMFPAGSPEHGVTPVPLRTYFPMAFRFKYDSGFVCGRPQDQSDSSQLVAAPLLTAAAYSALVFLFDSSTTLPVLSAVAGGFLATRMVMSGPDVSALPAHFRTAAKSGHFLPATGAFLVALACTVIVTRLSARRSPQRLATTYDRAALWLGAFWLGLLSLYLFPWMPSTPLEHSNALLFGLFVYSIASTGLALPFSTHSLSSHAGHARSAPAFLPSPRYPQILEPEINVGFGGSNGTFTWRTPVPDGVDGISMLVNDIERERKSFTSGAGKNGQYGSFELRRTPQAVPDYIRFSWLQEDRALGWSEAGIWEIDGAWSGIGRA